MVETPHRKAGKEGDQQNLWGVRGLVREGNVGSKVAEGESTQWEGGAVGEGGLWVGRLDLMDYRGGRQNGMESERRVLKPAHGFCEGSMAKRETGQSEDQDCIIGEWEAKDGWQGCFLKPDGGETEAVEAWDKRGGGSVSLIKP